MQENKSTLLQFQETCRHKYSLDGDFKELGSEDIGNVMSKG